MIVYRNAEWVHGQRKVGNPWSTQTVINILLCWFEVKNTECPNFSLRLNRQ